MYRPPENTNRVKSIKSKFENVENKALSNNLKKNGPRSDLNKNKSETQNLSRQLSDPAKRNIKRTPAFRIDVNSEKNGSFQRNNFNNRSFYFDKVQQFSTASKNCDTNSNIINRTENLNSKPQLIKSKSSHDFALIRSKFDKTDEKPIPPKSVKKVTPVYTEPVPKALRVKNLPNTESDDSDNTLRAKNSEENNSDTCNIHNSNTLRVSDQNPPKENGTESLTDTLKAALKKPLPKGPAPRKPPRTFEHAPVKKVPEVPKNTSFLHQSKSRSIKESKKHDARYMLNKLENALRNNRIRNSRPLKIETSTTTSGEDSDDSVLFKSKSQRELPSVPNQSATADSECSFNFNCLNGLTTCKSAYERIKEPNSAFFVSCGSDEPVYAEPFNFSQDMGQGEAALNAKNERRNEKRLYYMSTSLLCDEDNNCCSTMEKNLNLRGYDEDTRIVRDAAHRQVSAENSSRSSVMSDLDSAASTPVDENETIESSIKIRQLIDTFETKRTDSAPTQNQLQGASDGSNRIEELKISLQRTLERHLDSGTPPNEQPKRRELKTNVDVMIDKFQTYVKTMPKYQKLSKADRLFYCCLVVGWDSEKPQIKFKFPSVVKIPDRMEDLCYPEAASGPLDISDNAQCYSLVITNDKGERTFGYCRRVIPEGSTRCIPLAYCILSKHRAPRFYKKILTELESRHGIPDKLRDELISKFYYNKFPRPGESIKIDLLQSCELRECELSDPLDLSTFVHVNFNGGYGTVHELKKTASEYENIIINGDSSPRFIEENNESAELTLTLHHDTRYEESDLKPLHKLPGEILLKIFASLLLERKVILISCVISKLSSCVDALQSILYPFSWPHTFIPILPQCLWDVVESPTPVICGILSVNVINNHKIEHGIVVDLDECNILCEEGDEDSILSNCMKKSWRQGLALANTVPPEDYVHSVYLSDAYIKVFIVSLKHYKNHIHGNTFEKDAFIRSAKTKGIRRFLKWFTETTMFITFIDCVISNPESFSLFDKKIEMYGSDESNLIVTKLLGWKK